MQNLHTACLLIWLVLTGANTSAQTAGYRFTAKDTNTVQVSATFPLNNNTIRMVLRGTSQEHPNGTADFVKNLTITDQQGKKISYEVPVKGRWKLDAVRGTIVNINYQVILDHETHDWGNYGGIDAVSYKNADGIFGAGYTFFIVPDSLDLPAKVTFDLPAKWKAATPWTKISELEFTTRNTDDLLNNCFFSGTHHQQTFKAGEFEITVAVGGSLKSNATLFEKVLQASVQEYWRIFKAAKIKKYLVVVNEGSMTDGDAFNNSFDQLITGDVNENGIISWGNILAHETFHLWNGISMYSLGQDEWFKEGVTEYMSVKTLRKLGLINDASLLKKLESFHTRYWFGSKITSGDVTLLEAGEDKGKNVFMIYGGGTLIAFMLDVEINKATQNKKGLEDVLYLLYQRHGLTDKPYSAADLNNILFEVSGRPLGELIAKYVNKQNEINTISQLNSCGLGITSFAEEHYVHFKNMANPYNALFRAMFVDRK